MKLHFSVHVHRALADILRSHLIPTPLSLPCVKYESAGRDTDLHILLLCAFYIFIFIYIITLFQVVDYEKVKTTFSEVY